MKLSYYKNQLKQLTEQREALKNELEWVNQDIANLAYQFRKDCAHKPIYIKSAIITHENEFGSIVPDWSEHKFWCTRCGIGVVVKDSDIPNTSIEKIRNLMKEKAQ